MSTKEKADEADAELQDAAVAFVPLLYQNDMRALTAAADRHRRAAIAYARAVAGHDPKFEEEAVAEVERLREALLDARDTVRLLDGEMPLLRRIDTALAPKTEGRR